MFQREVLSKIEPFLFTDDVILLYWARQVWKTSIMKIIREKETRRTFFFDLENYVNLDIFNGSQELFIRYLKEQENWNEDQPIVIFIDEVQYMENPTSFLKYIHDHYPSIKFIVSWSSTLDIRGKMKDSMVWRLLKFDVYPLNFYEFLVFKWKENLAKQIRKINEFPLIDNEYLEYYKEFITYWGYPKVVLTNNVESKKMYLKWIVESYIEKDIRDVGKIRNIDKFNILLKLLASQSWNLLNISELAWDSVWISRETLSDWLLLLENTFIVHRITPFSWNVRSEVVKMPKIFMADTGIRNSILKNFDIDGPWFENAFFADMMHSYRFDNIQFYRTQDKKEIDFILDWNPFELKLAYKWKKLNALNFFELKYGKKWTIVSLKKIEDDMYKILYPREV